MIFEMSKSRLAVIGGASVVLIASVVGFFVFGDAGTEQSASATTAATSITVDAGDTTDVSVPATESNSSIGSDSAEPDPTSAQGQTSTTGPAATTAAPSENTDSTVTFTSSPTVEGNKVGCAEGLVLVGSNGSEPICQPPGQGCPDGYGVIGGVDNALLCKGPAGDVLRVQADGTVTIDTSVPFNGPVCQISDSNGNVVELTLAVDEQTCIGRGGEYFPDGLT